MSRCFPYPPPGYSSYRSNDEALIESIKLQWEREKAKTDRKKEKKREKKEKRREKKTKVKQDQSKVDRNRRAHEGKKSWTGLSNKKDEKEAELLERSSLTEEHEHPVGLRNPCCSSDSTQNSNKRKRHDSSTVVSCTQRNIIRIRLPLRKESDASAGLEVICSTSGSKELPVQRKDEISGGVSQEDICSTLVRTNNVVHTLPPRPNEELSCSTSVGTEIIAQDDVRIASGSSSFENEMQRLNSLYQNLIQNWVPPVVQSEQVDQEWLFGSRDDDRRTEKRSEASRDVSCSGSFTLWPRAQLLPEVDIYALPFTVPF